MSAPQVELRSILATAIALKKTNLEYSFNDFDVEEVYLPYEELPKLKADHPNGKLYLVTMAVDEGNNKSRTALALREIPIGMGFQKADVDPYDVNSLDTLVTFVDELYETVRELDQDGYNWLRTDALKDENETPYFFTSLHNNRLFEIYFTPRYNYVVH